MLKYLKLKIMKRLLFISVITLLSCNKEEIKQGTHPPKDNCDCDKIVAIKTTDTQKGFYYCAITTINECTKITKHIAETYEKPNYDLPKVGDCHYIGY